MAEDGVIKFKYDWEKKPIAINNFEEINGWRDKLYKIGLIGVMENGIGYGNISLRLGKTQNFVVSGSGTGTIKSLT